MAHASRGYQRNFTGGYRRGGSGGGRRGTFGNFRRGNPEPKVDMEKLLEGLERNPVKIWTVKSMGDLVTESPNEIEIEITDYEITDRKRIASYNWMKTSKEAKIIVPGAPKEFYEWPGGDLSGNFNEERHIPEDRTFDAIFTPVKIMDPSFKLTDYDIVSDMETLKGLFHICLQTVDTFRAAHLPNAFSKPGKDDRHLRIDVQMIGNTLLLRRQEEELEPAAGVGLEYRRVCSKSAPKSMMRGEQLDDGNLNGQFKLISGITMGNVRILLTDELDAARYPEENKRGEEYSVPEDAGMKVEIGGFKGNLDDLTPIAFASRSLNASGLHQAKWLTQYLAGIPYRYLGFHDRGIFVNPPTLLPLNEIRNHCGFQQASADLWTKVLEHLLDEIVFFARHNDFEVGENETGPKFAIVVTPGRDSDRANVAIHQMDSEACQGETATMISEKTLDNLMKTK